MPKRGEHIHKRKDGRWEGRYKSGTNEFGKTTYSSVYGKTYSEVKKKMNDISQRKLLEEVSIGRERTFREALLLWKETNKIKYKGSTEAKYDYLIERHILPELGDYKLSKITTLVLNDFMNRKLERGRLNHSGGLSHSYVRSIMFIVTTALQYAVNEQMCMPLRTHIHKPSIEKNDLRILTVEEQCCLERMLVNNIDATKLGILISLHTGIRIGEVCALSWKDIDFDNAVIHVRSTVVRVKNKNDGSSVSVATMLILDKPKTKSSLRDIPISSRLMPILVQMRNNSISSFVISNTNNFVSPRTYEYRFHKVLSECGLSSINYHALRHTFATRCIEVGVDIKTLSEILGHANISITLNTYVHSSMELKRKQLEKLVFVLE